MKPSLNPTLFTTWKRSVIYCVSFFAVFFIGIAMDLACGPEADPYDYYASFFHNTIQADNSYRSFYFNGMMFLNSDENPVNEADVNSAEWAHHLGNGVVKNDVNKAMYQLDAKSDSLLLLNYLKPNKRLPDSLNRNTYLKVLVSGRHNNDLQYYRFAKAAEYLTATVLDNKWNPKVFNGKPLMVKAKDALQKADDEKNAFLKLRYYYQAQRLMHYGGDYKEANGIYEHYIANTKSKSHLMGWALSLTAGEEWRTGNPAKGAFLFSKVFANYPERRIQAFHDFNNIHEKPQNIIKFAKTGNEKAFVYAITGFNTHKVSLKALEEVYRFQPKSPLIKLLLVREINKIEESYLSRKLDKTASHNPYSWGAPYVGEDSTVKKQRAYIPKLKAFCLRLATENKYSEPALGDIAIAYLSWIQDDNSAGLNALSATDSLKLAPPLEDQKQMVKLLLLSQKIKTLDTLNEQELVPSLTWLNNKVKWEKHQVAKKHSYYDEGYRADYSNKNYSASSRDFYFYVLAPAYMRQKDTAKAAMAILNSQLTIRPAKYWQKALGFKMPDFLQRKVHSYDFLKMIQLIKTPEKTPYLQLLSGGADRKMLYDLYDLLGTAYLREHKYQKAVNVFKNIPANKSKHTPFDDWDTKTEYSYDPFIVSTRAKYDTNHTKHYSKLMFALQMARLEKLIKTNPNNAAQYYYTMANGLYNTSFYGNSWYLTTYTWSVFDKGRKPENYCDPDFLKVASAKKYYLKARALSNDNEFKAKCTFMLALCYQKQIHHEPYSRQDGEYDYAVISNPYFKPLKDNYSKTAFYKTAISECSYFRDFLKGK